MAILTSTSGSGIDMLSGRFINIFGSFGFPVEFAGPNRMTLNLTVPIGGAPSYYIDLLGDGLRYNSRNEITFGNITTVITYDGGHAEDFRITGLETTASDLGDSYFGGPYSIFNFLLLGNDTLTGTAHVDRLLGSDGHDFIIGGGGADYLSGGSGNDHIYGQSASGGADDADKILGGDGGDYLQGNAGNDTLSGDSGSDRINGGADEDLIDGGSDNDTVNGNLGNDTIDGGNGNDSLRGGQGNDVIMGGAGNDVILGDLGQDRLSGGSGTDIFMFSGAASTIAAPDTITDFTDGTDLLSIGMMPAVVLTGAAQASFSAAVDLAQQLLADNPGSRDVAAISVENDSYLFYSSAGTTAIDSTILLANVAASSISIDDFV